MAKIRFFISYNRKDSSFSERFLAKTTLPSLGPLILRFISISRLAILLFHPFENSNFNATAYFAAALRPI